jgi:hypothetical protein
METWRPFPDDPRYEVSDLGRVRRASNGRIRKPVPIQNGYLTVVISEDQKMKTHYVHRMVARTFIGELKPGVQVRHGVGGKTDNRLSNLCLGTPTQNSNDRREHGTYTHGPSHHTSKLTAAQVVEIRARSTENYSALAAEFGVSKSAIYRVVHNLSYKEKR